MADEQTLTHTAYIALGTNLGDRLDVLSRALAALADHGQIAVTAVSGAWESSPVGPVPQPDYLNAAAALRTTLAPRPLLEVLLGVERQHGRQRRVRWGPRTLDLDLLMWGTVCLDEAGLTLPHPYLHRRRFVLAPLLEIAPDAVHPASGRRLSASLRELPPEDERVVRFADLPLPARD